MDFSRLMGLLKNLRAKKEIEDHPYYEVWVDAQKVATVFLDGYVTYNN